MARYRCFVCEKEVKDNEEFEWFGLDGSKIHKRCKSGVDRKCGIINNMGDDEFAEWIKGNRTIRNRLL